ncbi:hypothetical protein LCGC14_2578190, partial [marine sediment metagenome]
SALGAAKVEATDTAATNADITPARIFRSANIRSFANFSPPRPTHPADSVGQWD